MSKFSSNNKKKFNLNCNTVRENSLALSSYKHTR